MTEQDFLALEPRYRDGAIAVVRGDPMPEKAPVITGCISAQVMYEPNGTKSWGLGLESGRNCWVAFPFTTAIATAWELVEEMREEGAILSLMEEDGPQLPSLRWGCQFYSDAYDTECESCGHVKTGSPRVWAKTAPLAICIAYLKAKGAFG